MPLIMENFDFNLRISEFALLRFLFLGVLLFVFFRLLARFAKKADMRTSYRTWLRRFIPPTEGIVWFIFILIALNRLTAASIWSSLAIVLICLIALIWISWFALKDIIAGIIIKVEGAIAINDRIQLKEVTGQIKRMGYRIMEMETDTGETVNVPYSKVSGDLQVKSNPGEKMKSHRFELFSKENEHIAATELIKVIRKVAYNAPWSSLKKAPQVKLIKEKEGHKYFEVIIYALKVEYFSLIKNYLSTHLPKIEIK